MERRDCQAVIREILRVIPPSFTSALVRDLNWNLEDAAFKAPEETIHWERTCETLEKWISPPKEEWEFQIWSIFTTKSVEELKAVIEKEKNTNLL